MRATPCWILQVALFTRAWIEIKIYFVVGNVVDVALFTRAWIEIDNQKRQGSDFRVALFTRAWIEITTGFIKTFPKKVALFTRAWIEILSSPSEVARKMSPSSRGRGLKCQLCDKNIQWPHVALFTRAWIEIRRSRKIDGWNVCRPLHEGVDWNTFRRKLWITAYWSPSSRGRGLK